MTGPIRERLMVGGPTTVPPEVVAAGTLPVRDERTPAFAELIGRTTDRLRALFGTEHDVLTCTASTTGAQEGVIQNLFSPGDRILVAANGFFGERWAELGAAYRLDVVGVRSAWGDPLDLDRVAATLAADPSIRAALCVQVESSTGMINDVRGFAGAAGDRLCVVDAAASLGAVELRADDWGVDVLVGGSQKALMTPPGLAFTMVGPRAWAAAGRATLPRFYFDWARARTALVEAGRTPWTPAVGLFVQLDEALRLLAREGSDRVRERHAELGRVARAGCRGLGLKPMVGDEAMAAPTITAAWVPAPLSARVIVDRMVARQGIQLATGVGDQQDAVIRIGHCGHVDRFDVLATLDGLELVLHELGAVSVLGSAAAAALSAIPHSEERP